MEREIRQSRNGEVIGENIVEHDLLGERDKCVENKKLGHGLGMNEDKRMEIRSGEKGLKRISKS